MFYPQQLYHNVDVITSGITDTGNGFIAILKITQNMLFQIIMQNAVFKNIQCIIMTFISFRIEIYHIWTDNFSKNKNKLNQKLY